MLVLCLSFAIVLLDQVTKYLVQAHLELGDQIPVIKGLFSISHVHNTGAAWGIFSGKGSWLIALSTIMLILIVKFQKKIIAGITLNRVALGLMTSGILGNLIDRVRLGYVIDFLHFYWRTQDHAFPSFNVADSAICIGVGLYMLTQTFPKRFGGEDVPAEGTTTGPKENVSTTQQEKCAE